MLYYIKFEFNYIFIVIYTMMIKKEAVGMNKRIFYSNQTFVTYS